MNLKIATELLSIAKYLIAFEFPSKQELKKYLDLHPNADKTLHFVKKQESKKPKQELKEKVKQEIQKQTLVLENAVPAKIKEPYVYHATSSRNILGIWKEGLKPSEKTHWGGNLGEESVGKTFFATNPKHAEYFTDILKRDEPNVYYFTVRVPTEKLSDNLYHTTQFGHIEDENEVFTNHKINPEDIEVKWGEHGWKKLKDLSEDAVAGPAVGEWDEDFENE